MTGFDIALLLLIGLGAITGFLRGFVQEVLALGAWFLALYCIHALHTPISSFLEPYVGTPSGAAVLGFALLLVVPLAGIRLVSRWMGAASRNSVLGPLDRVLGFGFGAVKGTIIAILAFSILVLAYDTVWGVGGRPNWITQARSYPFINAASESLVTMIAERRQEAADAEAKALGQKHRKKN